MKAGLLKRFEITFFNEVYDMKKHLHIVCQGSFLLILLFMTGCTPKMGTYPYRVAMDEALRDSNTGMMPSIEVDFVVVDETEIDQWLNQDIDKYFNPKNTLRADTVRHSMPFTDERPESRQLNADSGIWQRWKGTGDLNMFIIASIPLDTNQFGVGARPRRLILPLDKARWDDGKTIEILVKPSGLACQTAMKSKKN